MEAAQSSSDVTDAQRRLRECGERTAAFSQLAQRRTTAPIRMPLWTFYDSVPETRRKQLLELHSFENIVGGLILCADVIAFARGKPQIDELRGCTRAEFLLNVPSYLYDAFFNSPVGYRAQYAVAVSQGEQQNQELVRALKTKLLAYTSSESDVANIERSIDASQAKIWINEEEVQAHYYDDSPEIDYRPWRENSENGAGLRAPIGHRLVVYGGWLDQASSERLNPYKENRGVEIHRVGFT